MILGLGPSFLGRPKACETVGASPFRGMDGHDNQDGGEHSDWRDQVPPSVRVTLQVYVAQCLHAWIVARNRRPLSTTVT